MLLARRSAGWSGVAALALAAEALAFTEGCAGTAVASVLSAALIWMLCREFLAIQMALKRKFTLLDIKVNPAAAQVQIARRPAI